jgi:sec-independent protein translocase protein TatA
MIPLFAWPILGAQEIVVLLVLGVLFFGKRLPEVGRYLGKGIVEFKKGMQGLEDDIQGPVNAPRYEPPVLEAPRPPQRVATSAPMFDDGAS